MKRYVSEQLANGSGRTLGLYLKNGKISLDEYFEYFHNNELHVSAKICESLMLSKTISLEQYLKYFVKTIDETLLKRGDGNYVKITADELKYIPRDMTNDWCRMSMNVFSKFILNNYDVINLGNLEGLGKKFYFYLDLFYKYDLKMKLSYEPKLIKALSVLMPEDTVLFYKNMPDASNSVLRYYLAVDDGNFIDYSGLILSNNEISEDFIEANEAKILSKLGKKLDFIEECKRLKSIYSDDEMHRGVYKIKRLSLNYLSKSKLFSYSKSNLSIEELKQLTNLPKKTLVGLGIA